MFIFYIKDAIRSIRLQGEIDGFREDFSLKKRGNNGTVEKLKEFKGLKQLKFCID
jgi:hypothetical protein